MQYGITWYPTVLLVSQELTGRYISWETIETRDESVSSEFLLCILLLRFRDKRFHELRYSKSPAVLVKQGQMAYLSRSEIIVTWTVTKISPEISVVFKV